MTTWWHVKFLSRRLESEWNKLAEDNPDLWGRYCAQLQSNPLGGRQLRGSLATRVVFGETLPQYVLGEDEVVVYCPSGSNRLVRIVGFEKYPGGIDP